MKIIFSCETEIGICDDESNHEGEFRYAEPSYSTIVAQTQAGLRRGIMKIEQTCVLRSGESVTDEPWVKPQTIFEPAFCTTAEIVELANIMHEQYVHRTRKHLPPQYQISRRHRLGVLA